VHQAHVEPGLVGFVQHAQDAQDVLDAPVGVLFAADHDRERPGLDLRDAS